MEPSAPTTQYHRPPSPISQATNEMAFITSFTPKHETIRTRAVSSRSSVVCSLRHPDDNDKPRPPRRRKRREDFQPFDGSTPLLPPWRPPSIEAEFSYSARHIVSRERPVPPAKKIVKVESGDLGTLFAEVVQEVTEGEGKLWLRPLLLDKGDEGTFLDLRGGSDVFLQKECVRDVDEETKTRLHINLLATESDVLSRAVSDERWNDVGSRALFAFINGLSKGV